MYKLILPLLFCSFVSTASCFADRYIVPAKYEDQEEIFMQGASIVISQKINSMSMYQTCEKIKHRKANFYFTFFNQTDRSINLFFKNLIATDQWGRPLLVLHKNQLISTKNKERNLKSFALALCAGAESINANNAGNVHYQSNTVNQSHTNFNVHSSQGFAHGNVNSCSSSTTQGSVHCEALRQQALRQVQDDTAVRSALINNSFAEWEYGLNHFYFDTTTIFPATTYGGNIQIEVPKKLEKDLEFIIFTFEVDQEVHSFCYYCPNR